MKKKTLTNLAILLVLALTTVQLGCGGADDANASSGDSNTATASNQDKKADKGDKKKGKKGEDGEEDKEEAVPVEVAALSTGPIESVLQFSSNLEAEREVKVFSQAKRLITQLNVEEGDKVRRGQVLVQLQDEEQRAALSKVKSQLAKAEREYERQQRLFQQKLISEQAYNDATYELDQLRIEQENAERELSYTEVKAPIDGTITTRLVNLGDQVQIGQHLFDLVDFDSLVARVFVPEKHLEQLRKGLTARLSSQATGDRQYNGKLKRVAPIVDPRSGTVKVTVDVGGQKGLRPGMYVDVDLVTAVNREAILVPKRALVYDNDQMFVFRLGSEEGGRRVERVFVEARLTDKYNVEPASGLSLGDQLVIAGQAGLKDGALVSLPGDPKEDDEDAAEADKVVETSAANGGTEKASL